MNNRPGFYRWESQAELLTSQPEESAIYYEWLLRLEAGARPGEALQRIGVADVRVPDGDPAGWVPVFVVEDVTEAVGRVPESGWEFFSAEDQHGLATMKDERGTIIRLRERAVEPGGTAEGRMNFDYSARNIAGAAAFYSRLLDLEALEVADDTYDMRLLSDGRRVIAGVFQLRGVEQLEHRPFWLTYFEVDSIEESVTRAVQSGSRVRVPPTDSPFNSYAVLDDPWGHLYGFSTMFSKERIDQVPMRGSGGGELRPFADLMRQDD